AGHTRHGSDAGQPGGTPEFTIRVTPDMCAEIAACSGGVTKRGPVYIWDAPIDDLARTAADIGTDFIPIVSTLKSVYDAVQRLDNGEDTLDVLMSSGAEGLLSLIPGGKAGKRLGDAVDTVADVADAAGDVRKAARGIDSAGPLPKPPRGPGSVPKSQRDPQRVWTPKERAAKREAQDNTCRGCGTHIGASNSRGHHINRHADGGPTSDANHVEVCIDCHLELHRP
ncbi:HNH endonuclease, partial [Paraliomyxa miuraensis]|uniref:HNH endonuclease n=2 Tax=Paraliomyxa miuraensis TaxID=376150 RepID=UPI00225C01DA